MGFLMAYYGQGYYGEAGEEKKALTVISELPENPTEEQIKETSSKYQTTPERVKGLIGDIRESERRARETIISSRGVTSEAPFYYSSSSRKVYIGKGVKQPLETESTKTKLTGTDIFISGSTERTNKTLARQSLGARTSQDLEKAGYEIVGITNDSKAVILERNERYYYIDPLTREVIAEAPKSTKPEVSGVQISGMGERLKFNIEQEKRTSTAEVKLKKESVTVTGEAKQPTQLLNIETVKGIGDIPVSLLKGTSKISKAVVYGEMSTGTPGLKQYTKKTPLELPLSLLTFGREEQPQRLVGDKDVKTVAYTLGYAGLSFIPIVGSTVWVYGIGEATKTLFNVPNEKGIYPTSREKGQAIFFLGASSIPFVKNKLAQKGRVIYYTGSTSQTVKAKVLSGGGLYEVSKPSFTLGKVQTKTPYTWGKVESKFSKYIYEMGLRSVGQKVIIAKTPVYENTLSVRVTKTPREVLVKQFTKTKAKVTKQPQQPETIFKKYAKPGTQKEIVPTKELARAYTTEQLIKVTKRPKPIKDYQPLERKPYFRERYTGVFENPNKLPEGYTLESKGYVISPKTAKALKNRFAPEEPSLKIFNPKVAVKKPPKPYKYDTSLVGEELTRFNQRLAKVESENQAFNILTKQKERFLIQGGIKGQKPQAVGIQKIQSQKPKPMVFFGPRQPQPQRQEFRYFTEEIPRQREELRKESKALGFEDVGLIKQYEQEQKKKQEVSQSQEQIQIERKIEETKNIPIERQVEIQKPIELTKETVATKTTPTTKIVPIIKTPKLPDVFLPPSERPFKFGFGKGFNLFQKTKYNVFVRKRGIFELAGTERTPGRAIILGRDILRNTARASFKVVSEDVRGVERESYLLPRGEFTRSKSNKNIFVQRREKRITTPGEKKEITFLGIQKLRNRRL